MDTRNAHAIIHKLACDETRDGDLHRYGYGDCHTDTHLRLPEEELASIGVLESQLICNLQIEVQHSAVTAHVLELMCWIRYVFVAFFQGRLR